MPVVIPATLSPRAPAGLAPTGLGGPRTREGLVAAGAAATGPRAREGLTAGVGGPRARDGLAAASARARQALVEAEHARAREAGLRRRFQFALNAQLSHSIFSGNQIHLRYKWLDGRLVGAWPTPRWEWVPASRDASRDHRFGPDRRDPLQLPAFELPPRFHPPTPPNIHFTHMDIHNAAAGGPRAGGGAGGAPGASGSSGTSGAVGAGAAVLALAALVLLARALERCLDQRLFKLLRRRSDEWFTPNVLATSHHMREEGTVDGAVPESPTLPLGDPPPPYSMCLPKSPQDPSIAEPPPPYSACYVAFGGPQDPVPRVYLNGPSLNSFQDTGQPVPDQSRHDAVPEPPGVTVTPEAISSGERVDTHPEWRMSRDNVASETSAVFPNTLVA
ncbi:uncharacterized protein LOC125242249 [Leguminivora glycinivorella]|uniref:uncharacterized protein LOC125242249 n=1 Tax=Leguminivora glycinivorella TaxID=1035111 RepID=UPI00200DBDB4|nr:uncharacterized protein LOC125242249 [Leguminivora glycinivorella]